MDRALPSKCVCGGGYVGPTRFEIETSSVTLYDARIGPLQSIVNGDLIAGFPFTANRDGLAADRYAVVVNNVPRRSCLLR